MMLLQPTSGSCPPSQNVAAARPIVLKPSGIALSNWLVLPALAGCPIERPLAPRGFAQPEIGVLAAAPIACPPEPMASPPPSNTPSRAPLSARQRSHIDPAGHRQRLRSRPAAAG